MTKAIGGRRHIWRRRILLPLLAICGTVSSVLPASAASALTADEKLITAVYHDFVFREPTLDELTWWTAYLSSHSRAQMAAGVLDLDEFEFLWVAGVNYQYLDYFDSEAPLLATQLSSLASTGNFVETELLVLEGAEYYSHAGGTNGGFVTEVYRDVLLREPDATGLAYWTNELDTAAKTRRQVARTFIRSTESAKIRIGGLPSMTGASDFTGVALG